MNKSRVYFYFILSFFVSLSVKSVYCINNIGCRIRITNDTNEKFVPVLLKNSSVGFNLVITENSIINLEKGDYLTFYCPKKNYLRITNTSLEHGRCLTGNILNIKGNTFNFSNILCKNQVEGELQRTEDTCGHKNGRLFNIGYQVTPEDFVTLIKICYDEYLALPLYAVHTIFGKEIEYATKFANRTKFSTEGIPRDVAAEVIYRGGRRDQKVKISNLLGGTKFGECYINNQSSYLARGHLAPDQDFLFASGQLSTYFYINTLTLAPSEFYNFWVARNMLEAKDAVNRQSINGGNWVRLEAAIRRNAANYQHNFTIITGTHEVMELPNANTELTKIFLAPKNRLPVPKFIWKIVVDVETKNGIAFVNINNPFLTKMSENDILCKNICKDYDWDYQYFNTSIYKGLIYCCDINELRYVVNTIPYITVRGVLKRKKNKI
ncbi:salivary protein Tsal2A-like [Diabrotica undecimpunctata]|uniref:salivary protein Tsal2A-like n=1 Tax=Diabrotica undecimpunctata TaxID=50387 RepID=UPI003B63BD35